MIMLQFRSIKDIRSRKTLSTFNLAILQTSL